jgi:dihydroflavonol-4-reductase
MPRKLVTGATGFVGSNLVAHLRKQDHPVRCLVRNKARAATLEELGAELSLGSLDDQQSLERAVADTDVVFHLAGRIHALSNREFVKDNVEGTRRVAEACSAQPNPPIMVLVSSIAAGGPSLPGTPRKESDPDQPVSDYGRSKLAAERAAMGLSGEVPVSILRPPIIFGPADPASLTIFQGVKTLRLHLVPGFRKFPVSIVHVADLCDALVRIAERGERADAAKNGSSDHSPGKYYIAAERTIKYGELGTLAGQAIGHSALVLPLPKSIFWLMGSVMEIFGQIRRRPTVLGIDKIREALAPAWECSDEKLRHELDYCPALPLEQRFEETAAWYREHGWL